jgi:hypothetical protein
VYVSGCVSHVHTHVHSNPLAADCMLTSRWVAQEMLAFLRRLTCVKPTLASTPSSKTIVCRDGAADAEAEESSNR